MEIIPIIYLKKRKILIGKESEIISFDDLLEIFDNQRKIYILDLDGIEKYKPNLYLYQKLSKEYEIWIDAGPRNLGDIVDSIMAGAIKITTRGKIWSRIPISSIKEITDYKVYYKLESNNKNDKNITLFSKNKFDGFVSFINKNELITDFKFSSFLRDICVKNNVYLYDYNQKDYSYWKNIGISGLFVDVKKAMELNKHEF